MRENNRYPKRILMIAPTPFFADRGCHVRILGEAKALIELGNQLLLSTYSLGRDIDPIPTVRTLKIPWYKKLAPGPSFHKLYIDLLLLWNVLLTCYRFRPDILHAHLHEGIVIGKIASKIFKIPIIADLQGSLTLELLDHKFIPSWRWLLKLMHWVEKQIDHMAHHLIVSSTHTSSLVLRTYALPEKRVTTLIDGVDLDIFSPRPENTALRASLGIRPDERLIVFIGVLTHYQGIDLLLEAIPQVVDKCPQAKCLIIGYPDEEVYRAKAQALGIAKYVCFTGKIPYADAPQYLSLAQVAVSPKLSTTEANLKLFTYMAMGLPTVVFDNPVNREILGDLGVYAKMGDVDDLARVLIAVIQDPGYAQQLGAQNRQKAVDNYSWLALGKRLVETYDSLLGEKEHGTVKSLGDRWSWIYRFSPNRRTG